MPEVARIHAEAYRVPMPRTEADGTLSWDAVTAVVVLAEGAGRTGLGWTYADASAVRLVDEVLAGVAEGRDVGDVPGSQLAMVQAVRNVGRPGLASCAVSAVDIALWDLKARVFGLPLADLFGRSRDTVRVYGSGGFVDYDSGTLAAEIDGWLAAGCAAAKIKVGQAWGSCPDRDLSRARDARRMLGDDRELFVDANGGYRPKQAVRMGHAYDDVGVTWFEEPVSSDDLAGLRLVRESVGADVTAGEYAYDLPYVARMCTAGAVDCMQIDATRVGGYTAWLQAAAVADALGLEVSGHCAPALHVPVAVSAQNTRHVEYFVDHVRVEEALFDGVPVVVSGALQPDRSAPGHALSLKAADAERYRIG